MSALIGTLAGFFSSFIPELFHFLKDSKDKAHELKLIDKQIEALKIGGSSRLEEIQLTSDLEESKYLYYHAKPVGVAWVDSLSALVRPLITYSFFLFYIILKLIMLIKFNTDSIIALLWTEIDQGIFCAVISFWFGQRSFRNSGFNGSGKNNGNGNGKNSNKY